MLYDNSGVRRQDRLLSEERAKELLAKSEYGFLAMATEQGGYGVPLNYVIEDDVIYVHCAAEGRKLSAIRNNPNVSFCVVGRTRLVAEKFTTAYESVVAFGSASIVEDEQQRRYALRLIVKRFAPQFIEQGEQAIERSIARTGIIAIKVARFSGKCKVIE